MSSRAERVADVFKTIGQPTVTYVQRDSGKLEKMLRSALNERGQLCLVTGPSKTGKTTLYREVLASRDQVPLIVQCDRNKTCATIWQQALEAVDFERIDSKTSTTATKAAGEVEVGGKLGWKWLAEATGRLKGTVGRDWSEADVKKRVLAEPGPDLLLPVLKATEYVLVIEDFHYLEEKEKILLFQQWKRFIDSEVSVLVLGTTHRAVDIANSNKDLLGRIAQIDVAHWSQSDLEKIITQGFDHLGVKIAPKQRAMIATEAVGLPIVVQQACLQIFTLKDIEFSTDRNRKSFEPSEKLVSDALHSVAKLKYTQFESYYSTLIRGPREKTRKYRTYELVLLCFTLDPIKFSLRRSEIDSRLNKMGLSQAEIPPFASLNSTLGALKKFQERRGFALLEWQPSEEILYIIEPSFLFYVRWRKEKEVSQQLDLFEKLLNMNWEGMFRRLGITDKSTS
ncbi:ATP-binding protein [Roseomonas chloroacetimidivorans]|uniref:ATP-binding protein n=1 Tax=Roseomonas chloroacetimidivorans TaxID=1766656 RepID=UPI003C784343